MNAGSLRFPAIGLRECLEAAKVHPNCLKPVPEGAGRSVAVGFWFNIGMQSSAEVRIAEDGAVTVMEGSPDIGGSRASMALMAAETLGVPYEQIKAHVGDTESTGFCNVTGGSRTTFATGMAVVRACEDIIAQCRQRAALTWDLDEEQVDWVDGEAVPKPGVNADVKPLSLADIARGAGRTGGPLLGRASLNAQGAGASFSCNFADTKVDTETGKVDVLGFTAVQDAGRAVHPSYVEGQMQGGAVQGIGWALNEEYIYDDDGVMENPRLPGLPGAGGVGHADDRHRDRRGAEPVPSVRCTGRGGDPDRGAAGGGVERRPRPAGIPHPRPAAVAAEGSGGDRRAGAR